MYKRQIVSKGISAGKSENSYRGLVRVSERAANARNYSQCDSLLLGDNCGAHTFPYMDIHNETAVVEHLSLIHIAVIFSTLLSSISWFSNSCIRLETISRVSLRYLEALFFPFVVRRAKVSFTCLATSSSLTSCFTTGFLKRSLLLLLRLRFCPPPPCPAGF